MIKYTVSLILWQHETNSKKQHPVYIKITINRQTRYISTGIYIKSLQWDQRTESIKESHPLAGVYNPDITTRKQKIISKIVEYQVSGKPVTAANIKDQFKTGDRTNIFSFVDDRIAELSVNRKRRPGTISNYEKHKRKLKEFVGGEFLLFEDITPEFLSRYELWLRENIKHRKTGEHKNYIHAIWKTLRAWFNAARKKKITENYPFAEYENPVYVRPEKDYLDTDEIGKFETFADETKDPVLKECAVYFLFGCYSGLRVSDWYQFDISKNLKNGRLRLRPEKTGGKNKWVEMIASGPLIRNIERMKRLPITLQEPTINEKIKIIAANQGIKKHITTHTGRHTFAVTICLHNGISSETAAKLMGITLQTFVENYSQVTQDKIDKETLQAWRYL